MRQQGLKDRTCTSTSEFMTSTHEMYMYYGPHTYLYIFRISLCLRCTLFLVLLPFSSCPLRSPLPSLPFLLSLPLSSFPPSPPSFSPLSSCPPPSSSPLVPSPCHSPSSPLPPPPLLSPSLLSSSCPPPSFSPLPAPPLPSCSPTPAQ